MSAIVSWVSASYDYAIDVANAAYQWQTGISLYASESLNSLSSHAQVLPVSWRKVLAILAFSPSPLPQHPFVDLGYAKYRGIQDASLGLETFYGIHYAAPPTGAHRWRPPVPIEEDNTYDPSVILNATSSGPWCIQAKPGWYPREPPADLRTSEDCLLLDVIRPIHPAIPRLPVVVQIHGGGYSIGGASTFSGAPLLSEAQNNLIWVQIQYRLGAYGFLDGAAVRAAGSANVGLLDQHAALAWVRRHVGAFGGDPAAITLWGASAGGGSVTALLGTHAETPEKDLPFRAAIAQCPYWPARRSQETLQQQYAALLTEARCEDLECLRGLPVDELDGAARRLSASAFAEGWYAYGDNYFAPTGEDLQSARYREGRFARVPVLVDRNRFEGALFCDPHVASVEQGDRVLASFWGAGGQEEVFRELRRVYDERDFEFSNERFMPFRNIMATHFWRTQAVVGDFLMNCPSAVIVKGATEQGAEAWKLVFEAGSMLHGATVDFVFRPSADRLLAKWLKSAFVSFVVAGDPNADVLGAGGPEWPSYGAGRVLRVSTDGKAAESPDDDLSDRCAVLMDSDVIRN